MILQQAIARAASPIDRKIEADRLRIEVQQLKAQVAQLKQDVATKDDEIEALISRVGRLTAVIVERGSTIEGFAPYPKLADIMSATCEHFGISQEDLLAPSKKTFFAHARWVAFYLSRKLTPHSYLKIAERFNRDHTTIIHGDLNVARMLATDETTWVVDRASKQDSYKAKMYVQHVIRAKRAVEAITAALLREKAT